MTNYSAGHQAEKIAAKYLEGQGYQVLDLNWRTPACEIDVVAGKNSKMYFVEVKYRQNNSQGSGFDYITPKKLKQMEFAASCWVNEHNFEGDYELSAIEVFGESQKVTNFLESVL